MYDLQLGQRRESIGKAVVPVPKNFPKNSGEEVLKFGVAQLPIEGLGNELNIIMK